MNRSRTNWTSFSRLTLLFLGLAICVFTWGLRYKLSLYDPPQAVSHAIPKAKLLTRDEQSTASESPLVKHLGVPCKSVRMTLLSLVFPLLLTISVRDFRVLFAKDPDLSRPMALFHHASLYAFFFRPPPTLA